MVPTQLTNSSGSTQQQVTQIPPSSQTVLASTSLSATGEMGSFSAVPDEIKAYIDAQLSELRASMRKIEDRFSYVIAKLPVSNGFSQEKIDSAKRLGIYLTVNLARKIFNSVNFKNIKLLIKIFTMKVYNGTALMKCPWNPSNINSFGCKVISILFTQNEYIVNNIIKLNKYTFNFFKRT